MLGIAAAILFFVGLIVFAVWIYNDVSQGVGTILMYATSFIIAATGLILTLRRRNAFTLILCGCGCGLLFISILLSYVYFGRMSDIVTFVLLLAWLAITLVLARKLNSILISILAHIGMVISLCFAYAVGLHEDKLILLLAYQLASIAVIVIGNTLCCKKTYRFGLFLSMIVTIAAGSFMQTQFIGVFPPDNMAFPMAFMPDWMASSAFFTQFLTASFLSYLLAGSTSKLENSSSKIGVHLVNKFLWTAALCVNLLPIVFRMAFTYSDGMAHRSVLATGIMAGIGFAVLLVHSIISLIMGKKGTLDRRLEEISVILSSAIASVLLLIFWLCCYLSGISAPCLPLLIIPAILLLWAGIYGGKTSYKITANILLGLDWILMAFIGFNELTLFGSIVLPFVYMLMYMLLIQWQHTTLPPERKEKLLSPLYLFNYLFVQVNAVIILISLSYDYKYPLLLVYLCTVNIIANIFRYNRAGYKPLCYCMRISEGIILLSSLWVIAFAPHGSQLYTGFSIALAVLTAAYAFINVHLLLKQRSDVEAVLFVLKLTLITLAVINGFTSWFDSSYIATLTAMGTLLLCLAAGYLWRLGGLVKYGLIGMLLCVLKLLSYDFFFCNSLTAFISLFAGGVLFFITQLLYNRFDTKAVPAFKTLLRIGQLLLLGMSAASVAFDSHIGTAEFTFSILLTVLLFVWSFFWTPGMLIRSEQKGAVLEGIKFTVLVLAVISGYTNWFNNGYVATLVAMSTAIICLAVGYLRKIRGLVLYGLIGAMFCILKLIFIDILVNFELSRLIAMLGGSLGFFAVNLLYNRFDTKNPAFTMLIRIGQLLTLAASAAVIAFTPHFGTAAVVVSILLTAQSFIWAFFQTPKTLGHSGQGEAVLEGIKLSVLVLATIQGHTDWFANAYILSFVCMITSLLCIIAGFIRRVGSLRLYGLVLTLVCVLKLVTWDVAGLETMLRTLSLIGGGIICFAISAIYSYSVKRLPISSEVVQQTIAPTEQFTPPDETE